MVETPILFQAALCRSNVKLLPYTSSFPHPAPPVSIFPRAEPGAHAVLRSTMDTRGAENQSRDSHSGAKPQLSQIPASCAPGTV